MRFRRFGEAEVGENRAGGGDRRPPRRGSPLGRRGAVALLGGQPWRQDSPPRLGDGRAPRLGRAGDDRIDGSPGGRGRGHRPSDRGPHLRLRDRGGDPRRRSGSRGSDHPLQRRQGGPPGPLPHRDDGDQDQRRGAWLDLSARPRPLASPPEGRGHRRERPVLQPRRRDLLLRGHRPARHLCLRCLETGSIGAERVAVDTSPFESGPDGGTVDGEGYLWSALVHVGKVARFAPDGTLDRIMCGTTCRAAARRA